MEELKKTPLYDSHNQFNARMVDFGGWSMPVQYKSIIKEHKHCRTSVSLFDTCHMGEFYFKGDIKESKIDAPLSFYISKVKPGRCRYGFLLNKNGGIIDDLIVYRINENEFMMVVNAATKDNDYKVLKSYIKDDSIFNDISYDTAKIDVQGPLSRDLLATHFSEELKKIPYFGFKYMNILNKRVIVSRTGYTGELGYEIYIDRAKAVELWDLLISDSRVAPAGLGARDVLRLEMGYSLYGNDIDEKTTPIEADLKIFVDFEKDFPGKKIIMKQKKNSPSRIKIAFKTNSRRSPRAHYKILLKKGKEIGEVTSGVFSPMLSAGIGMGYVEKRYSEIGTKLIISHDKISIDAEIVGLPFYKEGSVRK